MERSFRVELNEDTNQFAIIDDKNHVIAMIVGTPKHFRENADLLANSPMRAAALEAERDALAAQLATVTNAVATRNELVQAVRMFLYGARENDPDRKRERLLALKEAYAKVAAS